MTKLYEMNHHHIGLARNPLPPEDLAALRDEAEWDAACEEAAECMKRADAVAEVFDDGELLLPDRLAEWIVLANGMPRDAPAGIVAKLHEAIGRELVGFVSETMTLACKRAIERARQ